MPGPLVDGVRTDDDQPLALLGKRVEDDAQRLARLDQIGSQETVAVVPDRRTVVRGDGVDEQRRRRGLLPWP